MDMTITDAGRRVAQDILSEAYEHAVQAFLEAEDRLLKYLLLDGTPAETITLAMDDVFTFSVTFDYQVWEDTPEPVRTKPTTKAMFLKYGPGRRK
jgi:hypothetical protein